MRLIDRLRAQPHPERAGLVELFPTWSDNTNEKTSASFLSFDATYKNNGIVYACINARAKVFSEVRFSWRRFRDNGLWTDAGLDILENPWPNGTATELLTRLEQDVSLAGNAYLYRAEPNRLQRLRPDKVEIMSNGRQLVGYLYWPNGMNQGEVVALMPNEVAHWAPVPDPAKNFAGMSWLQSTVTEIRADMKMVRHQDRFFQNAATPNLFIKIEGRLAEDSKTRLRHELDRRFGGWENAYKTIVLDGGADMSVVGSSFEQMDFVNTMKSGEARIAAAAGVPPIIIGLKAGLDAATYSNYGMAMRAFADHTIRPMWNSAVASLSAIVPIPGGSELWFDDRHVAALQQDKSDEAKIQQINAATIRQYVDAGFTPDSAIAAVTGQDPSMLVHTGLFSIQLQEAGQQEPESEESEPVEDEVTVDA